MPYSYKEVSESEVEVEMFEVDKGIVADAVNIGGHVDPDVMIRKNQYEILDEQGDYITTVYSETCAEALVSHLNR